MHFVKSSILTLAIVLMGIVPIAAAAAIHCQGACAPKDQTCYSLYGKIEYMPCCDKSQTCQSIDQVSPVMSSSYMITPERCTAGLRSIDGDEEPLRGYDHSPPLSICTGIYELLFSPAGLFEGEDALRTTLWLTSSAILLVHISSAGLVVWELSGEASSCGAACTLDAARQPSSVRSVSYDI
ncbi:hypothetical protein DFH09DRAFT_1360578 [Mycena vulgaris]|nr:hypothetical protein DFH09DRAFT_1360578 [Mycena vulgaris]